MRIARVGIYGWPVRHITLFDAPANSSWIWISGLLLYIFCHCRRRRMRHEVGALGRHMEHIINTQTAIHLPLCGKPAAALLLS